MKLRFKKGLLDKKNANYHKEAAEVVKSSGENPVEIVAVKVKDCDLYFNISDFEVVEETKK